MVDYYTSVGFVCYIPFTKMIFQVVIALSCNTRDTKIRRREKYTWYTYVQEFTSVYCVYTKYTEA